MASTSQHSLVVVAPLVDGVLIALSGWLAYNLRWDSWQMPVGYLLVLLLGTALSLVVFPLAGAYQSWRGHIRTTEFGHVFVALLGVSLVLVMIGTLTKSSADFSRLWMAYWFTLAALLLFSFRSLFGFVDQHWLRPRVKQKQVLMVGTGKLALMTAEKISASEWPPMAVAGFVTVHDSITQEVLPERLMGNISTLDALLDNPINGIDEVWLALSPEDHDLAESLVQQLQRSCLTVRYVPDLSTLRLMNHVPTEIAGLTVIDLNASPLVGQNILLKSAFDKVFSVLVLILLFPLMLLIALAVKLDSSGPVLFRQARHGWDGKSIHILKFRTMIDKAEDVGEYQQATKGDKRITRIGQFLRRSSLDELPQFINVLSGDMSVVGPRPHPLALNEAFVGQIDTYMQRHRVKPGITGWAQVNGFRGETDTLDKMQHRIDFDLYYIEHWSLWLDIKVIFKTITMGWIGRNAY